VSDANAQSTHRRLLQCDTTMGELFVVNRDSNRFTGAWKEKATSEPLRQGLPLSNPWQMLSE
jgi:hypothetical protein